jgi:hypothetical protein
MTRRRRVGLALRSFSPAAMSRYLVLLSLVLGTCSQVTSPKQTFELVIHRNLADDVCTYTSLSKTQMHKDLTGQKVVSQRDLFTLRGERLHANDVDAKNASERVKLYSYDLNTLLDRARGLCGPEHAWTHQTHLTALSNDALNEYWDNQKHFNAASKDSEIDLEVVPLVVSGPSSNRVDLTFFADGCTCNQRNTSFLT